MDVQVKNNEKAIKVNVYYGNRQMMDCMKSIIRKNADRMVVCPEKR